MSSSKLYHLNFILLCNYHVCKYLTRTKLDSKRITGRSGRILHTYRLLDSDRVIYITILFFEGYQNKNDCNFALSKCFNITGILLIPRQYNLLCSLSRVNLWIWKDILPCDFPDLPKLILFKLF